jgi:predicted RNase H-like HicB family nuclease
MAEGLHVSRGGKPRPDEPPAAPEGGHPITIEVKVRLQAIALPEPGGGYSVAVPALPGCYTQGDSIEEVQANIVEAAEGWLAVGHDQRREQVVRDMTE